VAHQRDNRNGLFATQQAIIALLTALIAER
jgi:hypothetical protein